MRTNIKMEAVISVRVHSSEKEEFESFSKTNGFHGVSEFLRCAGNAAIESQGKEIQQSKASERAVVETNVHLDRIASMIKELMVKTANDNWQCDEDFEGGLKGALRDLIAIRKKVT